MEGFEWAANNLGAETPHALQAQGVNVFFAPNVSPDTKVVNLANGRVERFFAAEPRPGSGYYADYDGLARYCRERDLPARLDQRAGEHGAGRSPQSRRSPPARRDINQGRDGLRRARLW